MKEMMYTFLLIPCLLAVGLNADPTVTPSLGVNPTDGDFQELLFECVPASALGGAPAYQWFIDGTLLLELGSVLHEAEWAGAYNMGMVVRCSIQQGGDTAEMSDDFFAGVQVLETTLDVDEYETIHAEYQSTVPVPCEIDSGGTVQSCTVKFDVIVEGTPGPPCPGNVSNTDVKPIFTDCCFWIDSTNWDAIQSVAIFGLYDPTIQERIATMNAVSRPHLSGPTDVWGGVTTEEIEVTVNDVTGFEELADSVCRSCNDPHMTFFDGGPYEQQEEGEYVMYRHKELCYSVHRYGAYCNGGNTGPVCNCAVAIRAGSEVFVIDKCLYNPGPDPLITYSLFGASFDCDFPSLQIFAPPDNYNYEVYFPSGTKVVTDVYLSCVKIYPSVADLEQTEGLCGFLNGDDDDFILSDGSDVPGDNQAEIDTFSASWLVASTVSLFNDSTIPPCTCTDSLEIPGAGNCNSYDTSNGPCDFSQGECFGGRGGDELGDFLGADAAQGNGCGQGGGDPGGDIPQRKARDLGGDTKRSPHSWKGRGPKHGPIFPWWLKHGQHGKKCPDGRQLSEAMRFCRKCIHSPELSRYCSRVPTIRQTIREAIKMCMLDIELSGGRDYAQTALDMVTSLCFEEVKARPNLWRLYDDVLALVNNGPSPSCGEIP